MPPPMIARSYGGAMRSTDYKRSSRREFFSVKEIVKRWWKFITGQEKTESLPAFLLRLAICTAIYFQLSVFQRHHAKVRVLTKERRRTRRGVSQAASRAHGPESLPVPGLTGLTGLTGFSTIPFAFAPQTLTYFIPICSGISTQNTCPNSTFL